MIKLFPPITKQLALDIAAQVCKSDRKEFQCYSMEPSHYSLYVPWPDQPCWYIDVLWNDDLVAFRSSRVIVISRLTGKIFYDGEACS
jgi:hypothetical protein